MGFWQIKRHSAPLPEPTSSRDGVRSSKQRMTSSSVRDHHQDDEDDDHDDELDDHVHRDPRQHHHDEVRLRRRFMLFPWHRRQLVQPPHKTRAPPKSWSQSESEDLSPDNSSAAEYKKKHHQRGGGGGEGRRPFLRNSQRQRNSQDFADEEEDDDEDGEDYANDQVHDPRYRLEPPVKGSASMTSYAAASADVTKSFTLSTSSQSTTDTLQHHGRSQQQQQQQPNRSKLYSQATDSEAEAYQTRIIHPIIHKRDIFIDTARTPDAYQQQQHRSIHNNNSNVNRNTNVVKQQPIYHNNARPDPDSLLDVLAETTTRHTNTVKRPDPIEDMSFPTPKSHYSPCSFTSPRTTTSFNLPSYSVTGSMVYNAREQYGMESRAMQPGRGSRSPFKPTAVPSNSILASMLFRTTQLDDQPQSEQQQQPLRGGNHHHHHHHQRLPPSYTGAARKQEEEEEEVNHHHHQTEALSPRSQVDGYDYDDDDEEEDHEVVEVQHVENPYRQDPDGGRMNIMTNRQQPPAYKEPVEEFDPRQYYSEQYHPEDFMHVPDDIIHPQGSGVSSVSSVTDMWATVVDHHWNHANSRMIDLLENAMQEKFPGQPAATSKRQSNRKANPPQQRYNNGSNNNNNNNNNNLRNNNNKSGNLYEA